MSTLEGVRLALVVLHILGLAGIIGPAWLQARRTTGFDFRPMLAGAIVQLVTGVALVLVRRAEDLAVIGPKMAVKSGVALAILVAVAVGLAVQRKEPARTRLLRGLLIGAGAAAVVNVVIAVVWR